jgi:tetratricopeptide (TPR) repeat protein
MAAAGAVFVTALAVRLVHVWQMRDTLFFSVLMGDSRGYDTWARQIAAGDWVGNEVFYQAPLYPYFLGVIYRLFGHDLLAVRVIQAAIGALSCAALGFAGSRFLPPRAGLIAGLVLAVYAPAIFFDGLLQKSVLDVLFVCLSLALAAEIIARGPERRALWVALGVTMGALALTRENALVLIAVVAVWAASLDTKNTKDTKDTKDTKERKSPSTHPRKTFVPFVLPFLVGISVVLLPVAIRNYAVGGGFHLTTSQLGSNLYIGNNPNADGSYVALRAGRGSPEYERLDATELAEEGSGQRLTPAGVSSYWTRKTLEYVQSNPGGWVKLLARKTWLLANGTEIIDTEAQESHAEYSWPLSILGPIAHFGVLLPLAVLGAFILWPQRRRLWPLYGLTAAYAFSVILFFVVARYRLALVPFVALFAAAAIDAGLRLRRRGFPRLRAAWVAAAVVAVAANWPVHSAARQQAITENNLGTALQESGRIEEAIERYRRAIALNSSYTPAMSNLGSALRAAGRTQEAVAAYDAALAARADGATVHLNRGNALMSQGRVDEAILSFRQAAAADRRSTHAVTSLANALFDAGTAALEAGDFPRAANALREAVSLGPDSAEAHNNLGIALASQGLLADAISAWEAALRLKPDFADARRNLEMARGRK